MTVPEPSFVQYTLVASTAIPAGSPCNTARTTSHRPLEQTLAHVTPQAPQLFGSDCSSTHVPLHIVSHAQLPFEQP
jgi:hypothetical protein